MLKIMIKAMESKILVLKEGLIDRAKLIWGAIVFSLINLFFLRIALQGVIWSYALVFLFGLIILFLLRKAVEKASTLTLSPEGFQITGPGKRLETHRWQEIKSFEVYRPNYVSYIGWIYKDSFRVKPTPFGSYLDLEFPFRYGMSDAAFVELLESWRMKYSSDNI